MNHGESGHPRLEPDARRGTAGIAPGWLAARTVHFPGGCRAFNGFDPTLEFEPTLSGGKRIRSTIRAYSSLYADLKALELAPIGVDFLSSPRDLQMAAPANWRSFHPWPDTAWPCQDEIDKWAQIAHAGAKIEDSGLWDIARRISHQLRVAAWRLRQVSDAYRDQLRSRTEGGSFRVGQRFEDAFTWLGYLALQTFLVDACVLRDYLAELYAMYACPDRTLAGANVITSMSGLKKRVLDKLSSVDPVTAELQKATAAGGWLHVLGAYRDLVVHCVPLARADASLMALLTEMQIKGTESLPAISLPLPNDPLAISKARAAGEHLSRPKEEMTFFVKANRGEAPSMDGLIYAYISLDHLTRLARLLSSQSPVEPQVPHITDADVIGEIKVTRG